MLVAVTFLKKKDKKQKLKERQIYFPRVNEKGAKVL